MVKEKSLHGGGLVPLTVGEDHVPKVLINNVEHLNAIYHDVNSSINISPSTGAAKSKERGEGS